jgi:hypothetical protein
MTLFVFYHYCRVQAADHFGEMIEKKVQDAKVLLNWDKRDTTERIFTKNDINEAAKSMLFMLPNLVESNSVREENIRCFLDDGSIEILVFYGNTREITESSFLSHMVVTSMPIELTLHGFVLRNNYLGDYTYIRNIEAWKNPIELFFGYGNLIVSIRATDTHGMDPKIFPPTVVETAERISNLISARGAKIMGSPGEPPEAGEKKDDPSSPPSPEAKSGGSEQ